MAKLSDLFEISKPEPWWLITSIIIGGGGIFLMNHFWTAARLADEPMRNFNIGAAFGLGSLVLLGVIRLAVNHYRRKKHPLER